jgi:hypothetical protein
VVLVFAVNIMGSKQIDLSASDLTTAFYKSDFKIGSKATDSIPQGTFTYSLYFSE